MGRHVPVILALFLAGCAFRGPVPLQTWPEIEPSSNVIALDKQAYKLVAIQGQQISRVADGRLNVKLELANLSDKDLPVQIQTLYRNKAGMLSGESTPFEMVVLPGNGSKLYETTSLKIDAASFTVQVKTP